MPSPTPVSNGQAWLRWVIGFLATLVLGAYGYTYAVHARYAYSIDTKLMAIERKIDCLIDARFC